LRLITKFCRFVSKYDELIEVINPFADAKQRRTVQVRDYFQSGNGRLNLLTMETKETKETTGRQHRDDVFSRYVRAGKRTYFFDVRSTRADDYYLTITESTKRYNDEGNFHYEKHRLFLYKEDFEKFKDRLHEVMDFIIRERGTEPIRLSHDETKSTEQTPVDAPATEGAATEASASESIATEATATEATATDTSADDTQAEESVEKTEEKTDEKTGDKFTDVSFEDLGETSEEIKSAEDGETENTESETTVEETPEATVEAEVKDEQTEEVTTEEETKDENEPAEAAKVDEVEGEQEKA